MILKTSMTFVVFTLFWTVTVSYVVTEERALGAPPPNYVINCTTDTGISGICINYFQCVNDTIAKGGVIDENMLRSLGPSNCAVGHWCCSLEISTEKPKTTASTTTTSTTTTSTTTTSTTTTSTPTVLIKKPSHITPFRCKNMKSDYCAGCVTLHRTMDKQIENSTAFCMGSLIHDRIILTAATCLIASEKHMLFARVPASTNKRKTYYAESRIYNPDYNSGTHHNDYGFIILSENVNWGPRKKQNMCFSNEEMSGECVTFGLDDHDNFVSTLVEPIQEKCEGLGGYEPEQVMCGKNMDENIDSCFATIGAPIVCQAKNTKHARGEMVGVVRFSCVQNHILLGKLSSVTDWLQSSLSDVVEKFVSGD